MSKQPEEGVSGISEIAVYQGISGGLHFAAALGWGTLAGTLGLMAAILMLEFPNVRIFEILGGGIFVSIFVGLFTLAGLVVIGLPVTLILLIAEAEHQVLYAFLGVISGFAALLLLVGQGTGAGIEEFLFASAGGLAGFASAWRWGGWREEKAAARENDTIPDHQLED